MSKRTFALLSIITVFATALAISMPVPQVNALTNREDRMEVKASRTAERQSDALARLIQRADQMIAMRITSLQRLLSRIQTDKRLSPDAQASLNSDITTTIQNLTSLKAKIDADTDLSTAKTDVQNIVTSYHIYVTFEPKQRLLITVNNMQTASTNISSLSSRVQTLVTNLKNKGADTSSVQPFLDDVQSQLTTINTILATDKTLLTNVNTTTADPQSIFTQVRKDIAIVRADIAQIRNDFAQIRAKLKDLRPKTMVTPSTSPAK